MISRQITMSMTRTITSSRSSRPLAGLYEPRLTTRGRMTTWIASWPLLTQMVRQYAPPTMHRATASPSPRRMATSPALHYDALNRLTSVTTLQGVTEYAYDRASRLTRTTYPPGTTATQDYDATSRVTPHGTHAPWCAYRHVCLYLRRQRQPHHPAGDPGWGRRGNHL